jgi:dTMP kinase
MSRGLFFTFEGPEGGGKTTISRLLYKDFLDAGMQAVLTREPGGVMEGEAIRSILKSTEYHLTNLAQMYLFSASRNMFVTQLVKPNLEKGVHVISDRFADSTRAYQGYAGGGNMEQIEKLIAESTENLSPDFTVIIDIDPKIGLLKEVEDSSFSKLGLKYHQRVRQGYLEIAKQNPERCFVLPYQKDKVQEMYGQLRNEIKNRLQI